VPLKVKHADLGFRQIALEPDAAVIFAAWVLMLQLGASGLPGDRGTLQSGGRPLGPREMAVITGFPEKGFVRALEFLSQPHIRWIVADDVAAVGAAPMPVESPGVPGELPGMPGEPPGRMEGKEEGKGTLAPGCPAKVRPRKPLFDALAQACGSDPSQMTAPQARACGVALAAISKVSPELTPEHLVERVSYYRRIYPKAACTPNAIAAHWAALSESNAKKHESTTDQRPNSRRYSQTDDYSKVF
jgi:hypothetical protein